MTELVLSAPIVDALRARLLGGTSEAGAALLVVRGGVDRNGRNRLLAREVEWPAPEEVTRSSRVDLELAPAFVARVFKRAHREDLGVVFVHSHPGDPGPAFSIVDDEGEAHLARFATARHPGALHMAMVMSEQGIAARELGTPRSVTVREVGTSIRWHGTDHGAHSLDEAFDRQVRAFGPQGQAVLHRLNVGVVGLGGLGSVVTQQLAHLGVRRFVLVDHDELEVSNLNRVVGATRADVGRAKVDLARAMIDSIGHGAEVDAVAGDVVRASIATKLVGCDLIFGCTDSHGSRAVLNQLAYQFVVPYIDLGVVIAATDGKVRHIGGRVQMLAPGLGCLVCGNMLDPESVRRDMAHPHMRAADPYFLGDPAPQPAVISLNSTVASLGVSMMMGAVLGLPFGARAQLYDGIRGTVRPVTPAREPSCLVCSARGVLARGETWQLAARTE